MPKRAPELWHAAAGCAAVTAAWAAISATQGAYPEASSLAGHGIGVAGFVLMVLAAVLYPLRKLRSGAALGSMAGWLRFHMAAGLVGPYMVFLHTAARLGGLAGVTLVLTGIVVASGLVGRYIYTRIPRVGDGDLSGGRDAGSGGRDAGSGAGDATDAVGRDRRRARLARRRKALALWHVVHVPLVWVLFAAALAHVVAALYYATLAR